MKIRFAPPHLEQANCVPAVRRVVTRLSAELIEAELRIFQVLSDHEVKLSLHARDVPGVSVTVPKDWLYFPQEEERMRRCLVDLFDAARGQAAADQALT
jgi:hypothetical protein